MKLITLLFIFISSTSQAANKSQHKGLVSSLNLGVRYSSVYENRGIILYDDYQLDPVLGIFLLDDHIQFLGDSIGYHNFLISDWLRFRVRAVSITDKPLFPSSDQKKLLSVRREDTYELSTRLEFFLPGYNDEYKAEIDIGYAKDMSVHYGNYLDLQTKIKIMDFRMPFSDTKIEPQFYTTIGWGDRSHNKYFYGPSVDAANFNNFSYGLWFSFPDEADRNFPIIQIRHFEVLGDSRMGQYAKEHDQGWLISAIMTYGVLE